VGSPVMDLVQSGADVALKMRVHLDCRCCCGLRLRLAKVLLSEKELSV
jgi:hypothetical protein